VISIIVDDVHNLKRFLLAQDNVYESVLKELSGGRKQGHWMWFIFPQVYGLGRSETTVFYAIKSIAEAKAFLGHPILGTRLEECTETVMDNNSLDISDYFGSPDDLKLRSSMTLFSQVAKDNSLFNKVIQKYFGGTLDNLTVSALNSMRT